MKTYVVKIKFDNGMSYDDHWQETINAGVFSSDEMAKEFIDLLLLQLEKIIFEARLNEGYVEREWISANTTFPSSIVGWVHDLPGAHEASSVYDGQGSISFSVEEFSLDRTELK